MHMFIMTQSISRVVAPIAISNHMQLMIATNDQKQDTCMNIYDCLGII
jgi:hypothetical protein